MRLAGRLFIEPTLSLSGDRFVSRPLYRAGVRVAVPEADCRGLHPVFPGMPVTEMG